MQRRQQQSKPQQQQQQQEQKQQQQQQKQQKQQLRNVAQRATDAASAAANTAAVSASAAATTAASALLHPPRLTMQLWRQLHTEAANFDDSFNIKNSGYDVMIRFLFCWQSSIYKLLWLDVLIWCVLYAAISLTYRLAPMSTTSKQLFEDVVRTVDKWSAEVPLTFLLGFFVSSVISRWYDLYKMIPKLGGVSMVIRTYIRNLNAKQKVCDVERAESIRKHVSRYLNLSWVLCMWQLSGHLRNRFKILRKIVAVVNEVQPEELRKVHIEYNQLYNFRRETNDPIRSQLEEIRITDQMREDNIKYLLQDLCLINEDPVVKRTYGDLITPSEIEIFRQQAEIEQANDEEEDVKEEKEGRRAFSRGKQLYRVQWWLPLHWALALVEQSFEEGFVEDTGVYLAVTSAVHDFGNSLSTLSNYATRSLPLVYSQVGIITVYTMYLSDALTKQFLDPTSARERNISGYWLDMYFPLFALLKTVFFLGWFRVALILMDPFGSDDGDFLLSDVFSGNLNSGRNMSSNEKHLYPKKLQPIIEHISPRYTNDCLHSEAEDAESVVLQAEKFSRAATEVKFNNKLILNVI